MYKRQHLDQAGIFEDDLKDRIVSGIVNTAESIASRTVSLPEKPYGKRDAFWDRILTGRLAGYPAMIGLLALILDVYKRQIPVPALLKEPHPDTISGCDTDKYSPYTEPETG